MPTSIVIEVGNLKLKAELNDSATAKAVARALPIESDFETWGDGYFFPAAVEADDGIEGTTEVDVGDIAFAPQEGIIGIFYGPTPASPSDSDGPVPASAIHPIGKLEDDPTILRVVAAVGHVRLAKVRKSKES